MKHVVLSVVLAFCCISNSCAAAKLSEEAKCGADQTALFLAINSQAMSYRNGTTDDEYIERIRLLIEDGAEVDCNVAGERENALDLARAQFPAAVPVIEKALEVRADRLRADALINDSKLLQPYLVHVLVQLVSDYVATRCPVLGRDDNGLKAIE